MTILIAFIISVAASAAACYICKWLDSDDSDGSQPNAIHLKQHSSYIPHIPLELQGKLLHYYFDD